MNSIEPIAFVDGPAMLLAGIRQRHAAANAASSIEAQWHRFGAIPALPGRVGSKSYGVICGGDEAAIEFMCAHEVASFATVPAGVGRIKTPAQHYAVFLHPGKGAALADCWQAIWQGWLPQSAFKPVPGPEFEVRDEQGGAVGGAGVVQLWSPVAPRDVSSG